MFRLWAGMGMLAQVGNVEINVFTPHNALFKLIGPVLLVVLMLVFD
jgi:hypothetical protein